jgi:flagellar motor component MotA
MHSKNRLDSLKFALKLSNLFFGERMKHLNFFTCAALISLALSGTSHAGVFTSEQVIQFQQFDYNKQQVLNMIDDATVQHKLIALGVNADDALKRLDAMTPQEVTELNRQLNEAPAGGIVGTVVTVLVVVAVLDLMGITDVYPFIRPI